jgi:hypothetical protein
MARARSTVYIDEDILRATRAHAARTGKRDSDVVEQALREYLGLALVQRIPEKADLSEEDAMKLAYDELHAMRSERGTRVL